VTLSFVVFLKRRATRFSINRRRFEGKDQLKRNYGEKKC